MAQYTFEKIRQVANKKDDRILLLKVVDNKKPLSSIGNVDPQLFSGENKLHAVQNSGLWSLRYEKGAVPMALKQQFTGFNTLLKYAQQYFKTRNVEIKEVLD